MALQISDNVIRELTVSGPSSEEEIKSAERELGVHFPLDAFPLFPWHWPMDLSMYSMLSGSPQAFSILAKTGSSHKSIILSFGFLRVLDDRIIVAYLAERHPPILRPGLPRRRPECELVTNPAEISASGDVVAKQMVQ